MYYQNSNQPQFMHDEDLLYTILADLKRTVREYATAATESSCPQIRQMFTELTNDSLRLQGDVYNLMKQLNMYSTAAKAPRQDLDKSNQDAAQLQQKNRQFVQQKTGGMGQYAQATNPYQQQQSNQNPYYM